MNFDGFYEIFISSARFSPDYFNAMEGMARTARTQEQLEFIASIYDGNVITKANLVFLTKPSSIAA